MRSNGRLGVDILGELDSLLRQNLEELSDAFNVQNSTIKKIAADKALESVRAKYPHIHTEAVVMTLWDGMSLMEKVIWWLVKLLPRGFKRAALEEHLNECDRKCPEQRFVTAPPWLITNPKEEEIISFRIGIRKQ